MATTAVQIRARTDQVERHPDPEVPARPRPPRQYSAAYKLRVLAEYERLDKAGKGALLRREGLYTSLISEWRKQRDRGALKALGQDARRGPRPSWCLLRQSWVRPTIMRLAVAEFTYPLRPVCLATPLSPTQPVSPPGHRSRSAGASAGLSSGRSLRSSSNQTTRPLGCRPTPQRLARTSTTSRPRRGTLGPPRSLTATHSRRSAGSNS